MWGAFRGPIQQDQEQGRLVRADVEDALVPGICHDQTAPPVDGDAWRGVERTAVGWVGPTELGEKHTVRAFSSPAPGIRPDTQDRQLDAAIR
jgi:hypothetical protein